MESIGRCKYYVSFINDHTKKVWDYFMKQKGEVFQHLLNFKAMVEKEGCEHQMPKVQLRGRIFFKWIQWILEGIKGNIHVIIPHSKMEFKKKNKHIVKIACAMLNEKNLLNYFWAEVVLNVVYIMNWTPIITIHGITPKKNS